MEWTHASNLSIYLSVYLSIYLWLIWYNYEFCVAITEVLTILTPFTSPHKLQDDSFPFKP